MTDPIAAVHAYLLCNVPTGFKVTRDVNHSRPLRVVLRYCHKGQEPVGALPSLFEATVVLYEHGLMTFSRWDDSQGAEWRMGPDLSCELCDPIGFERLLAAVEGLGKARVDTRGLTKGGGS